MNKRVIFYTIVFLVSMWFVETKFMDHQLSTLDKIREVAPDARTSTKICMRLEGGEEHFIEVATNTSCP